MYRKRHLITVGVLAFVVGTLFRLGDLSGVGLFRMFGTMGIGITGAAAAVMMTRWQGESAKDELHRRLRDIPKSKAYKVPAELRARMLDGELLVEIEGNYYLIASSTLPNFRGRRHARRVNASVLRLAAWGPGFQRHELGRILVMLRRQVRDDEREFAASHGIVIVNPDGIGEDLFVQARELALAS